MGLGIGYSGLVHEMSKKISLYIRNFVFGVEDSLVSTGGVLTGIAFADVPRSTILLTGLIVIFVESFSMGAGSFLSEHSVEGYTKESVQPVRHALVGGVIMFFSYFFAGFITLVPYVLWEPTLAIKISVSAALISLFVLGIVISRISKVNMWGEAFKMLLIGGIAMALGMTVGHFVS